LCDPTAEIESILESIVAHGGLTMTLANPPGPRFNSKRLFAIVALLLSGGSRIGPPSVSAADNPIVLENQQPGSDQWQPYPFGNDVTKQIKGYASATSVNKGESITFFVTVNPSQTFTMDVYRIGWYQGKGGRLMQRIGPLQGNQQSSCPTDPSTGLIECQWTPAYTLNVPAAWTTGIYLVLLTNAQGYHNYISFVVRDDGRRSDLLYQQSVTTYQAYNNYPNDNATGKSLYDYNSYGTPTLTTTTRAVKASFDRPYLGWGDGGFLTWEIYFVRWLERSGYDVSYSTNVDTDAAGSRLLTHKGFLAVGHDEYWSQPMRNAAEAARDAGVSLGFFAADTAAWQMRFEPSPATGAPNRVVVCYKSRSLDPVQGSTTTVKWRDAFLNRPEQTMIGVQSTAWLSTDITQTQPYIVTNSAHWAYNGTGLRDGDSIPLVVGYETDRLNSLSASPPSVNNTYTLLSRSPVVDLSSGQPDYSNSSMYQAASGAWVFAAGTISWGWALDKPGVVDSRLQQTTANILNRFIGLDAVPSVPTGLWATGSSTSQINLGWTDSSANETNFVLERGTDSAFSSVTSFTLPANQATYSDSGLAAATTYYYRVKAIDGAGSSGYSNVTSAVTLTPPLSSPSDLAAVPVSATQIGLSWSDNSGDETGFVIERSLDTAFSAATSTMASPNQTAYNDAGLTAATTYYYRVKAVNASGSSAYSNVASAATPSTALTGPAAPTNLTAVRSGTSAHRSLTLYWTDNADNESSFAIERSTDGIQFDLLASIGPDARSYRDRSVARTRRYYYRVRALNAAGSSDYSNVASAVTR